MEEEAGEEGTSVARDPVVTGAVAVAVEGRGVVELAGDVETDTGGCGGNVLLVEAACASVGAAGEGLACGEGVAVLLVAGKMTGMSDNVRA